MRTVSDASSRACLLLLAAAVPCLPARAGAPPAQDPPVPDEQKRLEAWPELRDKERVTDDVLRLRKANTPEMGEQARDALIADGAMVAPLLLEAFEKERDEEARERVLEVLDAVVGAPHTRLLAPWFANDEPRVRIWALRKAALYPDPGVGDAAREAWAAVQKRGERAAPGERYAAAVCLVSSGDPDGLPEVFAQAREEWKDHKEELRAALQAVRGEEAERELLERLHAGDRKDKSAALRLLAVAGTEKTLPHLGQYLDSTDNTLRIDAINACRGIVDGEPPLEQLPVFEAIGLAEEWMERIR